MPVLDLMDLKPGFRNRLERSRTVAAPKILDPCAPMLLGRFEEIGGLDRRLRPAISSLMALHQSLDILDQINVVFAAKRRIISS